MGLGKTVQTIAFLAYLRERGVWGPFLIVVPLSTISNWMSEFKRFLPTVNSLMYHGTPEERAKLRSKQMKTLNSSFPVIVTSYEIVMNDRKHLQRYKWKYIVVDEGHRLKNLNCRLIRELKSYTSANRLLLTGTPLQNNLSELWSLLNFLLPDIFDDLESFQRWFDFSDVNKKEGEDRILEAESSNQVVSKLHHILQPFLLRRLKQDVEKDLPKKREYLVYCPLSPLQVKYYEICMRREMRSYLLERNDSNDSANASTETVASAGDVGSASGELGVDVKLEAEEVVADAGSIGVDVKLEEEEAVADAGSIGSRRRSSGRLKSADRKEYKEMTDAAFYRMHRHIEAQQQLEWSPKPRRRRSSGQDPVKAEEEVEGSEANGAAAADDADNGRRYVNSLHLLNLMMQLRKVCNHPYLFDFPTMEDGETLRVDEDIIALSGKMLLLDRLLPALLGRGHRVLIFSQMTRMLDILQGFLEIRKVDYCRIDGSVHQADRQEQLRLFNTDPSIGVFLLSTRAGGLGLNLTAADTCIIFDSDWVRGLLSYGSARLPSFSRTRKSTFRRRTACTASARPSPSSSTASARPTRSSRTFSSAPMPSASWRRL